MKSLLEFENLTGLILITGLIGCFYLLYRDSVNWEQFKVEHHCEVVAHRSGQMFNTINTNGTVGIGSTAPETGYKCDDGVTYYR